MSPKFNELVAKLREIFEIDRPELDFGIYRILHSRAKEIDDFLLNRLAQKVQAALASNSSNQKQAVEHDLATAIEQVKSLGMDPDQSPKVRALKEQLASFASFDDAETQVYAHLLTFFSRYYEEGDFVSKRRYKEGVYAIPYAGEEVKLHWANADQYYIKSGESFSNYDFTLDGGVKVHFTLVAAETAKDNIKDNDAVRCFVLFDPASIGADVPGGPDDDENAPKLPTDFLAEEEDGLHIYFRYQKCKKGTKQKPFLDAAIKAVSEKLVATGLYNKYPLLAKAPTEKDKNRTVLEKHLTVYTAKNTSDYFIHKDLKTFLTRELDFYIKNEMMHLDDIQDAKTFKSIELSLRQIQTVRLIATELIAFMAQLEDFQKKLWLKKKFVVDCNYCITMDRVPEELRPQVLANERQLAAWKQLGTDTDPKAGNLLAIDARMVDTKYFDETFKAKLLAAIPDVDAQCDGLLIHSDNFQAINSLKERYREEVQSVYIDPPYNTGSDGFLYRDAYKHSSWLSLMCDRLKIAEGLMASDAGIYINVNDIEDARLKCALPRIFGKDGYITTVITKCSTASSFRTVNPGPVDVSDRILIFSKNKGTYNFTPQPVVKEPDLSHFSRYVVNPEENPSSWRFAPIKLRVLNDLGFKCEATKNGMKVAKQKMGAAAESIIEAQCLTFAIEHADAVFETKSFQKPSNWLKEWIEKSQAKPEQIFVVDRDGDKPIIMMGGRQFYFLSNNVRVVNGRKCVTEPASTIWTDIDTNNLKHEGDVSFANGKKPLKLLSRIIGMSSKGSGEFVLDYFAGSGTTAHAVIDLNRQDDGHRKYILVEMGDHFSTVLMPRIQKVVYAPDWKDGKAVNPEKGISHCFKYLTLESYEDALNNITLVKPQGETLFGKMADQYLLRYMLDTEAKGSLLNTDDFKHPFDYKLKIAVDSSGASAPKVVDLPETFKYLVGLTVGQEQRQLERGFIFMDGTLPDGRRAAVIWRDVDKVDNAALNKLLEKLGINPADREFDVIYVNGDHAVANVTVDKDGAQKQLKVVQLENAFLEAMFAES